jgi:outer membrane protein
MNGNLKRICAVMLFAVLACRAPAFGFGLSYPLFKDPLHTNPPVLEKGVILPGDTAPIPCSVQKDFSHPLSLSEAVDLALCYNPQVRASWADIKIKAGALGEALAAYWPTLNGTVGQTYDRTDYPGAKYLSSTVNRTTLQAGLSWRIFDFGGRAANRRAAQGLLAAALATHNAALQTALADVTQAYFDAMTAKAALKAATESEDTARDTLISAKAKEERGVASQSDRLRAATALDNAVLEKNRADGDYRKALAVLGQIMGVPGTTVITMPEEVDEDSGTISRDLNSWLEEAEKNHPAIIAAKEQVKAARNQVAVARSAGLPTLNLFSNYYENTSPGQAATQFQAKEFTAGVGVSIPIFDGFSSTYKVRGAQAQVEQKEAQLADTENQVALQLIKAYVDATSSLQNLGASANLLKTAREALSVSRRRYDKGAADITEMLSTQTALSNARKERIRSIAEWDSARLRLLASAGQMGRSSVIEENPNNLVPK